MAGPITINTPDLGDFENVPVIEIFVGVGDVIAVDDPLVAIESDKAVMEVPASHAGTVAEVMVAVGDTVSTGQALVRVRSEAAGDDARDAKNADGADDAAKTDPAPVEKEDTGRQEPDAPTPTDEPTDAPPAPAAAANIEKGDHHAQLVVLGSGPGGYTAAFRAADLGLEVILIERHASLGGVCLNVGCIPSKALLHVARVISESGEASEIGLDYPAPEIDLARVLKWKNGIVSKLTGGLAGLAKKRKVTVIHGAAVFTGANALEVTTDSGVSTVSFDQAIIAAGSEPVEIPGFPHDDPRVMDSTGALELDGIPEKLLIIGGGIIGLEMATVYHALGSRVSVVEMLPDLMAGADPDLVRPLFKRIESRYENIWLSTRVTEMKARKDGIKVSLDGEKAPESELFDKVLVSVGRTPNGHRIGARAAGVEVTERGFIEVDNQQRTNLPHVFAIGDIVGQPMLAHKAVHEGKVAAEVAAGHKSGFDARVIPSVAYTDPEVAWVGLTETQAREQGIDYGKGAFPWAASGRALSQARSDGVTKLLFDKDSGRILGAGVTGINAGDLIAEAVLAIEMNADAQDIGLTIHPHPTLAETLGFAAEMFEGTITDLYLPKRK